MRSEKSDYVRENYLTYYLLSYFNQEKVTRVSQILHILRGKRTPSMFYLAELHCWQHGFAIEKRIERKELQELVNRLLAYDLIIKKEKGYLLSDTGKKTLTVYFEKHYFPDSINHFSNISLRRPFWDRFQLYTQVFSEYSYQNSQYIPIIKNPRHQENIRQLFRAADGNISTIFKQWIKEQVYLFQQIDEVNANVLANFLTGHEQVGQTSIQLAQKLEMQEMEFFFYIRDLLEELVEIIKANSKQVPLVYEVLKQTNQEVFLGLSQSTYQSYQMLQKGADIQQIARQRSIKENTVKEHILEMAFILDEFPYQHFVPEQMAKYLNQEFEQQAEYSFKQAVMTDPTIEFYQYRLIELERMRSI